jgi:hypothetical protein
MMPPNATETEKYMILLFDSISPCGARSHHPFMGIDDLRPRLAEKLAKGKM